LENPREFPIYKIVSNKLKLSIIIPCYNEAQNIPSLFNKIENIKGSDIEIILVDNGSTDETAAVLANEIDKQNKTFIKIIRVERNIGYGHGIMSGVRAARGDIISWTHADLQTDPTDVVNAYLFYIEDYRYKNSILKGKRVGRNLFDAFFTFGMGVLSSILMGVKLSDINAQPKMFHRKFIDIINTTPDDFSLDLYFLYQAKVNGYQILEYPVHFGKRLHGEAKGGGTLKGKWKLVKRTWAYMKELKDKQV